MNEASDFGHKWTHEFFLILGLEYDEEGQIPDPYFVLISQSERCSCEVYFAGTREFLRHPVIKTLKGIL